MCDYRTTTRHGRGGGAVGGKPSAMDAHHWLLGGNHRGERDTPLEGYAPGTLARRDFVTLKEGAKLTDDIINEVGRRIATSALMLRSSIQPS